MKNKDKLIRTVILMAICILFFWPLAKISIYSRPQLDDYSYSKWVIPTVRENGSLIDIIKAAINVGSIAYNSFDGTYIANPIKALQPGIWGEQYYYIGAVCLFILTFVCLLLSFRNLHKLFNYSGHVCVEAAFMMLVLFTGMPSINQGVYWFNAAWNYTSFYFLALLNITIIGRYIYNEKRNIWWLVISSILSFICSGGNYITSYFSVMIIAAMLIPAICKKRYEVAVPFILSLISFAIEYFAPGRTGKQADAAIPIVSILKGCLESTGKYFFEWTNFQWIMMVMVMLIVGFGLRKCISTKLNPLIFLGLSYLLIFALLLMPYIGQGNEGPVRVTNVIWMTYMILTCMNTIYIEIWLLNRLGLEDRESPVPLWLVTIILIPLFCGCIIYPKSNIWLSYTELKDGTAQLFAAQCDGRYEAMRNANEGDELETTKLVGSDILFKSDITSDPDNWKNKAWKLYYGVGMHIVEE